MHMHDSKNLARYDGACERRARLARSEEMQRAILGATLTVSHARAGVVYPLRGPLNKDAGRRLTRFGPLIGWAIDLAAKNPVVRLAHATTVMSPVCTLLNPWKRCCRRYKV